MLLHMKPAVPTANAAPTQAGFTLLETLIALGILAVLSALALPNFASMLARTRVDASLSAFANSLHFARNEAISRNRTVLLCRTAVTADPAALPQAHFGTAFKAQALAK